MEFQVSAELFSMVIGGFISALFSYFPALNTWFAAKPENAKKLIQLGLMSVLSIVVYLGSCSWGFFQTDLSCGQVGIWRLATILISSIVGNQGSFRIQPQLKSVSAVKVD